MIGDILHGCDNLLPDVVTYVMTSHICVLNRPKPRTSMDPIFPCTFHFSLVLPVEIIFYPVSYVGMWTIELGKYNYNKKGKYEMYFVDNIYSLERAN